MNGQKPRPIKDIKRLSPTSKYPEKELNAIIAKYQDDTASIRRYVIEYWILEMDADGVYWLIKPSQS
jgi:hypothetical protein